MIKIVLIIALFSSDEPSQPFTSHIPEPNFYKCVTEGLNAMDEIIPELERLGFDGIAFSCKFEIGSPT